MDKKRKLKKLRSEIIEKYYIDNAQEVFFFPGFNDVENLVINEDNKNSIKKTGVKGFWGTGKVMFIGLNPSTGCFPKKSDIEFYKLLKENNLQDSHITDLVKLRAKNDDREILFCPKEEIIEKQIKFLIREIKILEPKKLVIMGDEAKEKFNEIKNKKKFLRNIPVEYIWHFSYGYKHKMKFKKQLKKINEN